MKSYEEALQEAQNTKVSDLDDLSFLASMCLALAKKHRISPELVYYGAAGRKLEGREIMYLGFDALQNLMLEGDVRKRAKEIAPDYPNINTCNVHECLYAIRTNYEGLQLANDDCHKVIAELQGRLELSNEEVISLFTEKMRMGNS